MTSLQDRERQLAEWLVQSARNLEAERQRERMEEERVERLRAERERLRQQALIREYEEEKAKQRELEEAAKELTERVRKAEADLQRRQYEMIAEALVKMVDERKRQEWENKLGWYSLIYHLMQRR